MCQHQRTIRQIAAHSVLTPQGFLSGGMITFDGEGTVLEVSAPANLNSLPGVEFYSGLLIPGMVNAHTHLELSYLHGVIPEGTRFTGFAASLGENRHRFTQEDVLGAIDYRDAQMWAEGVQVAGDVCNGGDSFKTKRTSRIAYHSFLEMFGLKAGRKDIERLEALRDKAADSGLAATITPHATYSLNEDAFRAAVDGYSNTPLSIHFMEDPGEVQLYQGKGGFRSWYDNAGFHTDFTEKYASPTERVIALVPASRRILLIHNTFIGDNDIELLKTHFGDNVTFVLCPRSNLYINNTLPPVQKLREHGVRIALGTDSLASNSSLSIVEEMKALKGIPLVELLGWATSGGANALGMDNVIGSFEAGKRPGAVVLTGIEWENMTLSLSAVAKRIM